MIGNDIVSLERTGLQPRSENPRFLSRVLTAQEHQLLSQQPDKERALWTLWALKESTYKLEYRAQQRRFFAPKRYECVRWCCGASGFPERAWVTTPDGCYEAILDQQEGYVHAVVGSVENIQVGVAKLGSGSGESASLRLAAEAAMALSYGQPISISKPGESVVPVGKWANEAPAPWISLSHHEGWGGFAFVACG